MNQQRRTNRPAKVVVVLPRRSAAGQHLTPILVAVIGVVGSILVALLTRQQAQPAEAHGEVRVFVQAAPLPTAPPRPTEAPQVTTPNGEPESSRQLPPLQPCPEQRGLGDAAKSAVPGEDRRITGRKRDEDGGKGSGAQRPGSELSPPVSPALPGSAVTGTGDCSASPKLEQKTPSRKGDLTPRQTPVLLYYQVTSTRTRQVEYARLDDVTHLLKSVHLTYACGRPWKDGGLSPLRVPIVIHKATSWQSFSAKTVAHRERIMGEMVALGIETRTDRPEDIAE